MIVRFFALNITTTNLHALHTNLPRHHTRLLLLHASRFGASEFKMLHHMAGQKSNINRVEFDIFCCFSAPKAEIRQNRSPFCSFFALHIVIVVFRIYTRCYNLWRKFTDNCSNSCSD